MPFLSAIVTFSLRNRPVILIATLILILLGIRAVTLLPIDAVPDVTNIQVQVITSAPALAPVEVEQYVTVPVERAMAGIPNVVRVRSISKYGLSVVTVDFTDDTNIYFARQLVNERMSEAKEAVLEQYGTPEMGPISTALGEVFQFVVRNDRLSLMELEELLDWYIAPALRTTPGIVEVNSFGGEDKQYQVVLDPKRLQAAGVSVAEVVAALEKANKSAGGGYLEHNREHFVIGSDGLIKSLDDLRRVVIGATKDGVPITISTVGDARFGPRLRRGAASKDGHGEVVVGVALMLMGENSRSVTEAVKAKIEALKPSLPPGTRIEPFYDRAALVNRTIHTVGKNLLEGAALVVLVLLLLLGELRAGIVVAIVIPLSMLFAVIAMNLLHVSGNLMSLGAIDFGLIVDGAVIIVENAVRRLAEEGRGPPLSTKDRIDVVQRATLEVLGPAAFGVLIIAIVYLPIVSLTGVEGKMFKPMATTVLLALSGSFLLSLTVVPVLTSYLVQPRAHDQETWLLRTAHRWYRPLFSRAMNHGFFTMAASLLLLVLAGLTFSTLGAEFIPQLDEGDVLVEARRLPGVALSESVATDARIQRALLEVPEVEHVVSKTGAPELATDPMGMEQTDVYIALKDRALWRSGLSKQDLAEEIGAALEAQVPEVAGGISQPIQMRTNELVAGVRSDVGAIIYGPDLEELSRLGEQVAVAARTVAGAADVRVEQGAGLRYLKVIPDREKLARYGLTIEGVNLITETMSVGHQAGVVLEGERRFGLVVKTDHGFSGDPAALERLPLKSVSGQLVPLGDVARLELSRGPLQVSREQQSRRLTVELNVRGRDMVSVVADLEAAIAKSVHLPVGYRIEWGGQFQHFLEARARLLIAVPLALGLILFLLWMAFRALPEALVIFLNIPFAAIGGIFALWARSIPFSISAGVGFIALFGVAVLNGLVLVSFARARELEGATPEAAIREAAELRFRPVLMTALVASLGFVPMALSTAPGSEVQRPLATVVIGGLISATLLTLLLLPTVYRWSAAWLRRS